MQPARASLRRVLSVSAVILSAVAVTGCQSGSSTNASPHERIKSDPNEAFSSKEYGVAASPRVTDSRIVRKGGGRAQVGKPYKVRGKWYYPKDEPGYVKTGKASWYGSSFHGRLTANGEVYDMFGLSAAHPTFPLPSYARVTNLETGASLMVRVNDRGPYARGRVMDMSSRAADLLGYKQAGIGDVKVEYVGKAPVEGDDTAMLMATYRPAAGADPINDGMPTGVMIAMNEAPRTGLALAPAGAGGRAPNLPGVRPLDAIDDATRAAPSAGSLYATDGMSVGSIIGNLGGVPAPIPAPRAESFGGIVSSYAALPLREGAAGALAEVMAGERIEIGLVENPELVAVIRAITADKGKLIVDSGEPGRKGSVSLAFQANPGENVDRVLEAIWEAGAAEAFVLRD